MTRFAVVAHVLYFALILLAASCAPSCVGVDCPPTPEPTEQRLVVVGRAGAFYTEWIIYEDLETGCFYTYTYERGFSGPSSSDIECP